MKFLVVNKKEGNSVIQWIKKFDYLDQDYRIVSKGKLLYIPILALPSDFSNKSKKLNIKLIEKKDEITNLNLENIIQKRKSNKPESLKNALKDTIPAKLHDLIPNSFDIIGNIAIIELNREEQIPLRPFIKDIGSKLIKIHKNIDSIYEKAGDIEGDFRTRSLNFVSGKKNSKTIYKENNCRFLIDIKKSFFTPRLAFERKRIANFRSRYSKLGYTWDMFCGVGPFLIQIAKKSDKDDRNDKNDRKDRKFIGTDINPYAIKLAKKNVGLNKLKKKKISFITQDISNINFDEGFNNLKKNVSRFIMNLPEKNLDFIKILPQFIHPKGALLHIYQFNEKKLPFKDAKSKLQKAIFESANIQIKKILNFRIVKPFSPALDTTVLDVIIINRN